MRWFLKNYPIAASTWSVVRTLPIMGNIMLTAARCPSADREDIASSAKTCWKPYLVRKPCRALDTEVGGYPAEHDRIHFPPSQLEFEIGAIERPPLLLPDHDV